MTPPEGLQAGKYFIPGDTIVQNPTHTMFRGTSSIYAHSPLLPLLGQDPWRVGSRYCHGIRLHPALRKIPLVLSGRTIRMGWAFYTDASRCQMRGTFPTRTNSSPSAGRRGGRNWSRMRGSLYRSLWVSIIPDSHIYTSRLAISLPQLELARYPFPKPV